MNRAARGLCSLVLLLSAAAVLIAGARPAGAVPVFARKYQTSCQTCHVIFPKLNAHGEAFRLNGYRMPAAHAEEEPIKEKPSASVPRPTRPSGRLRSFRPPSPAPFRSRST